jgi:hypothetical protein
MNRTSDFLRSNVKHILFYDWDPIGINDLPEAQGEYDSYVPRICEMLREGCSFDDLYRYLRWIEFEHMGLDEDKENTSEIAKKLTRLQKIKSTKMESR